MLKLGVTGHRQVDAKNDKFQQLMKHLLSEIKNRDNGFQILSPLAEGSDRFVAKACINGLAAQLVTPLPMNKDDYMKDFSNTESVMEFQQLLKLSKSVFIVNEILNPNNNNERKQLYRQCGEYVVDNCDILVAIWDGKESNGVGGTAEIVEYAINKNKKIIHLNPNTLDVKYHNLS